VGSSNSNDKNSFARSSNNKENVHSGVLSLTGRLKNGIGKTSLISSKQNNKLRNKNCNTTLSLK
jgi:hypothetical protein